MKPLKITRERGWGGAVVAAIWLCAAGATTAMAEAATPTATPTAASPQSPNRVSLRAQLGMIYAQNGQR